MKQFEKSGVIFRVDDDVYNWLMNLKTFIKEDGYLMVRLDGKIFGLHRFVIGAQKGQIVDHIDGDITNNLRENLRFATPSQSSANRKSVEGKTSKYKGVHKLKVTAKGKVYEYWECKVKKDKKTVYRKTFNDELEAAKMYDIVAKETHGEYAKLNFPLQG